MSGKVIRNSCGHFALALKFHARKRWSESKGSVDSETDEKTNWQMARLQLIGLELEDHCQRVYVEM